MNNLQRSKLDSYRREQSFDLTNTAELAAVPDYLQLKVQFESLLDEITGGAAVQEQSSGVTRELVAGCRLKMAETVHLYCMRGSVKAGIAGDTLLAIQLKKPVSYFNQCPKAIAVERAENMVQLMKEQVVVLTTIGPADIQQMEDAIAAFKEVMDKPVINRQHRKSQGTDALPGLFEGADRLREQKLMLVKSFFYDTKPELVDELVLAQQMIQTGKRHTRVVFTIKDSGSGEVMKDVAVTDVRSGKQYTSDETGGITIAHHLNGEFEFVFAVDGIDAVHRVYKIVQGVENIFEVGL